MRGSNNANMVLKAVNVAVKMVRIWFKYSLKKSVFEFIYLKNGLKHTLLVSSKSKLKQSLSGAVDLQQCILGKHLKYM